jgi:hypothetical protein
MMVLFGFPAPVLHRDQNLLRTIIVSGLTQHFGKLEIRLGRESTLQA